MFGKKSFVGLDFGHHTIKVVQAERTPGGFKVVKAGWAPTPKDCIRDGIVANVEAIAAVTKSVLRHAGVTCKDAIISVQGSTVVVRSVRMPKMSEAILRKSIRFEAGRYIPTSVEDSFVEFEILGDVDETQMEVLIVAAPRDVVESRVKVCEELGMEVQVVDVSPFSSYRSLIEADYSRAWGDETFALIDLGAGGNNVSIISKSIFVMTRTISQGNGSEFTEALRTFFDLSEEDAETGKSLLNVAELLDSKPTDNPPLRVLHPRLEELVREIRRSINYYESQQVDGQQPMPVTSIVLTGGGAKLQGIDRYLSEKLGLPVTNLGIFSSPHFANCTPHEFGAGLDLSVAGGLAIRPLMPAA